MGLSNESIKYYAFLASYYLVYKLNRLNTGDTHLYLLGLVYHPYQQAHDNLISSLIYQVQQLLAAAKEVSRKRLTEHPMKTNQNLQKAGYVLGFFTDDPIPEDAPFYQVKRLAFAILGWDKIQGTVEYIASKTTVDEILFPWEQINKFAEQSALGNGYIYFQMSTKG